VKDAGVVPLAGLTVSHAQDSLADTAISAGLLTENVWLAGGGAPCWWVNASDGGETVRLAAVTFSVTVTVRGLLVAPAALTVIVADRMHDGEPQRSTPIAREGGHREAARRPTRDGVRCPRARRSRAAALEGMPCVLRQIAAN
jgi:hypothetical protein